jgi:hypothetical protein
MAATKNTLTTPANKQTLFQKEKKKRLGLEIELAEIKEQNQKLREDLHEVNEACNELMAINVFDKRRMNSLQSQLDHSKEKYKKAMEVIRILQEHNNNWAENFLHIPVKKTDYSSSDQELLSKTAK